MQRTCASTVTPGNTREIGQVNARIAPQASTPNLKLKHLDPLMYALSGMFLLMIKV